MRERKKGYKFHIWVASRCQDRSGANGYLINVYKLSFAMSINYALTSLFLNPVLIYDVSIPYLIIVTSMLGR